jgi:hypothetical protein
MGSALLNALAEIVAFAGAGVVLYARLIIVGARIRGAYPKLDMVRNESVAVNEVVGAADDGMGMPSDMGELDVP